MIERYIAGLIFLAILGVLDIKTFNIKSKGYIPAALTTSFLIISLIITRNSLYPALLSGLIGLLFIDWDEFKGLADYKCIVACGMLFQGTIGVFVFFTSTVAVSFLYKLLIKQYARKTKVIPYIPVILVSFLANVVYSMRSIV